MDVKISNEKKIKLNTVFFFPFSSKDDNSKEALNLLFLRRQQQMDLCLNIRLQPHDPTPTPGH